ncbi:MAG: carotenoid 1,2-hydratase, partial [Proteobacteria bacterium]|nr:carotenoid 1,2-hydratase [Pseudomonadota bacterium]
STGLAGARARPYSVWLENWRAFDRAGKTHLVAQEKNVSLKLTLSPQKPIALHGDQGLSPKSLEKGNASYYYSQTRIETTGRIKIGSNSHQVQGSSWLDREWSTSTLGRNQSGWDWFSIQLDDGREIMLFQIRQNDGTTNSFSSGSLVDAKGAVQRLKKGDFEIQVLDRWRSPDTKALYPSGWRIGIPGKEMELTVVPYIKNQEHHHSFAYWEGAVKAEGKNLSGFGYVELTGYLPPSR